MLCWRLAEPAFVLFILSALEMAGCSAFPGGGGIEGGETDRKHASMLDPGQCWQRTSRWPLIS